MLEELPISATRAGTAPLSEYPEGFDPSQVAEAAPPPLEVRLKAKFWKTRLQALQQLWDGKCSPQHLSGYKQFLKDSQLQCLSLAFRLVEREIQSRSDWDVSAIAKSFLEKVLPSRKADAVAVCASLLYTLVQRGQRLPVLAQLAGQLKAKPKQQAMILGFCSRLVQQLGEEVGLSLLEILAQAELKDLQAKGAALQLCREVYRYIGKKVLKGKLKPELQGELLKFIDQNPIKQLAAPKRVAIVQRVGETMVEEEIDCLQPFGESWLATLLGHPKWNQKKEELDQMVQSIGFGRIKPHKNLRIICDGLREMAKFNHQAVQLAAFEAVARLAHGLLKRFQPHFKVFFVLALDRLRDKKGAVVDRVQACLQSLMLSAQLQQVQTEIKESFSEKNAKCHDFRVQVLKFLLATMAVPQMDLKRAAPTFRAVVPQLQKMMDDASPEVRQAAAELIARLKLQYGDSFFGKFLQSLPIQKYNKINSFFIKHQATRRVESAGKQGAEEQAKLQQPQPVQAKPARQKETKLNCQIVKAVDPRPAVAVLKKEEPVLKNSLRRLNECAMGRKSDQLSELERAIKSGEAGPGDIEAILKGVRPLLVHKNKVTVRAALRVLKQATEKEGGENSVGQLVFELLFDCLRASDNHWMVRQEAKQVFQLLLYQQGERALHWLLSALGLDPATRQQALFLLDSRAVVSNPQFRGDILGAAKACCLDQQSRLQVERMLGDEPKNALFQAQSRRTSKEERLAMEPLNPWPLQGFDDQQHEAIGSLLKQLPESLQSLMRSSCQRMVVLAIEQLGAMAELPLYSDIVLKWMYWRLLTGRKSVVLQTLRLGQRLVRAVGVQLSDIELAILGGGLRGCLGDEDPAIVAAAARVCRALPGSRAARLARLLVNVLVGDKACRRDLLAVLRESLVEHLREELITLAKIPEAAYSREFYQALALHYSEGVLSEVGFNFEDLALRRFISFGWADSQRVQQLFMRVGQEDFATLLAEVEAGQPGARELAALLVNMASNFRERHLMGRQFSQAVRKLGEHPEALRLRDQSAIGELLEALFRALIYAKENKAASHCAELLLSVNSLLLRLLEGDHIPPALLLPAMFRILEDQRRPIELALVLRCLQRMLKQGRLAEWLEPTVRQLCGFVARHYPGRNHEDQVLKLVASLLREVKRMAGDQRTALWSQDHAENPNVRFMLSHQLEDQPSAEKFRSPCANVLVRPDENRPQNFK